MCKLLFILCCSSARFEGSLNMDLNEIAMNLVPFPRLHYLVPSLTPLYTLADVNVPTRRLAVLPSVCLSLSAIFIFQLFPTPTELLVFS